MPSCRHPTLYADDTQLVSVSHFQWHPRQQRIIFVILSKVLRLGCTLRRFGAMWARDIFVVGIAIAIVSACGRSIEDRPATMLHTTFGSYSLQHQGFAVLANKALPAPGNVARHIVQFKQHIDASIRASFGRMGITVLGYMPQDAWLVLADPQQVAWARKQRQVLAVVPQPLLLKVHPQLVRFAPSRMQATMVDAGGLVVVEVTGPQAAREVAQIARAAGATVWEPNGASRLVRIAGRGSVLQSLLALPQVNSMEPAHPMHLLNDHSFGIIQSARMFHAPIWQHGLRGQGQLVGISDTGVDVRSCFFADKKIAAYQNLSGVDDLDGDGHGTHVAGSIAGDKGANGLYDLHDGMAPAARLVVQDVGNGSDLVGIADDVGELFARTYDTGVRVHSNSWGGGDNTYDATARSVDAFVHAHPDFLALFANGNQGEAGDGSVSSPATAKSIISVAAIDSRHFNVLAEFSSRGPTADMRVKPTLVAPGVGVLSAARGERCGVVEKSGTSMATPTAAGAAVLVRQYFVEGFYPTGVKNPADARQPSAALIKATMLAGAQDVSGGLRGTYPGRGQGFGRLRLDAALYFAGATRKMWLADEATGLQTGRARSFLLRQARRGALKVALTWTDPPGLAGAGQALVNDLDLTVYAPGGNMYRGNVVAHGASVANATAADHRNVEEVVLLSAAAAGTYTLTVRGTNIPIDTQNFALVALYEN